MYDMFLNNIHSDFIKKIQLRSMNNLLDFILNSCPTAQIDNSFDILEIGPGKGYFMHACKQRNLNYFAIDRSINILNALNLDDNHIFLGEVPSVLDTINYKFDIILCAYVVEHLKSGIEVFDLFEKFKHILKENGIVILFTPNSLKQKMEFWNIDYTHIFPTSKRNIYQALLDCNFKDTKVYDINGIYISKFITNKLYYSLFRLLMKCYSYNFFSFITRPFYKVPLYDINNFFYRVYCFLKEENLMFITSFSNGNKKNSF